MDTPRKPRRYGRPSKGDRDTFAVKVSIPDGDWIRDYADETGLSYQEILAPWVLKGLNELRSAHHNAQEELPMSRAL